MDYEFIKYETDADDIATITLNRPPSNAFNADMRREFLVVLRGFHLSKNTRALIITGKGEFFSAGEDLGNIDLDASDTEMASYAKITLQEYQHIVRAIMSTDKPVIAALNGKAAGAGLSIALACDFRFTVYEVIRGRTTDPFDAILIMIPAFAGMGLVPDCGMMATLPRLFHPTKTWRVWHEMCDKPGFALSVDAVLESGLVHTAFPADYFRPELRESDFLGNVKHFMLNNLRIRDMSGSAYTLSKEVRNRALLRELDDTVFPWEIQAQTKCLQSEFFKQKAREFLAKQKSKGGV